MKTDLLLQVVLKDWKQQGNIVSSMLINNYDASIDHSSSNICIKVTLQHKRVKKTETLIYSDQFIAKMTYTSRHTRPSIPNKMMK
jgi:hypothetical protein